VRTQGVAARKHAQVLQHDGIEQGSHQLFGWRAQLLQAVDVGFGEDAALARDLVELEAAIAQAAEFDDGDAQLDIDFVDHRARAAGALVIHRRDIFLAPATRWSDAVYLLGALSFCDTD
jgi:hypothetical protein